MKTIAFYLPQYHETEENNQWWGKGFTEWTGVKKATPLFPGHYQPREPLNDNYYDLTNPEALRWQAELARKYDVHGFCIYHYWFGDKQLLQKPAEILLQNKDIDINYCFSWANESWIRTWSALEGNNWNESADGSIKRGRSILAEQKYGNKKDWTVHFEYLLQFFKDDRYIRVDNKPVLAIWRPQNIKCLHSMLKIWEELAKQNGFDGLYIIGTNSMEMQEERISAHLIFEPRYYWKYGTVNFIENFRRIQAFLKGEKKIKFYWYGKFCKEEIKRDYSSDKKVYLGGMVGFDKTPREGENASIFLGNTPKRFKKYYGELIRKSVELDNDMVFINAWNEWGEGAYLEPDKKYKYKYLEAIHTVNKEIG